MTDQPSSEPNSSGHRRRPRYSGKYPRRFEQKYKELSPELYPETVAKVAASGKTPAGTHRPILVDELMDVLKPAPGMRVVDCTLGYGGHARALLKCIQPGGRLLGLDQDPEELPRTEARLRAEGYGPEALMAQRTNFAGVGQALRQAGWTSADLIMADLGVSSMQLDNPARGFTYKFEGPLDMRMNPGKGEPAALLLARLTAPELALVLAENADEPRSEQIAERIAGKTYRTTLELARALRQAVRGDRAADPEATIRRVFQALRVAVNHEFSSLESLLRELPYCLSPSGRAAILTFHSGEDRRVKQAFLTGLRSGIYESVATEVIRPTPEEARANPRSAGAKLRWAQRSGNG